MSENASFLLNEMLPMAVYLNVQEYRSHPFERLQEIAQEASAVIAAHGDDLMYGGKHCAETFNAMGRALAVCSFVPGGVTFMGQHYENTPIIPIDGGKLNLEALGLDSVLRVT